MARRTEMQLQNWKRALLLGAILASVGVVIVRSCRRDPPLPHRTDSDLDLRFGIGVWIFTLASCEGGNVKAMAEKARDYGLSHVLIKTADSDHWFLYNRKKTVLKAINAFHKAGIRVYGWNYIYGKKPEAELAMAKEVLDTDVDGLVFDVEKEFTRIRQPRQAAETIFAGTQQYRDENCPGKIIGYSTFCRIDEPRVRWRYSLPFEVFGRYSDYAMPQAYWKNWKKKTSRREIVTWTPRQALIAMCNQWSEMERDWRAEGLAECCKPIVPTGHAYDDSHPDLTYVPPKEVASFLKEARGYQGTNWWRWDLMGQGHWEAIRSAPRIPALKPPYKPVRPTGKEVWWVSLIRATLYGWLIGCLPALLVAKYWWGYKRRETQLAYALLWPYLLIMPVLAKLIDLRYRLLSTRA